MITNYQQGYDKGVNYFNKIKNTVKRKYPNKENLLQENYDYLIGYVDGYNNAIQNYENEKDK